jgi:uncharacterized membrane protein
MMMHGMDHSGHGAGSSHATPQDEAGELLAILRRRFAEGEITEAELEERMRVLGLTGQAAQASHGHH